MKGIQLVKMSVGLLVYWWWSLVTTATSIIFYCSKFQDNFFLFGTLPSYLGCRLN